MFRYVPYHRPVVVRVGDGATERDVERCQQAARVAGVTLVDRPRQRRRVHRPAAKRCAPPRCASLGRVSDAIYAACDEHGIPIDDAPVSSVGRIELLHWVREQSVTQTMHRYGNVQPWPEPACPI